MIIKENQILKQFEEKNINYKPILLYGPNQGLIRENIIKIRNIFKLRDTEEITFTGKTVHEHPESLIDHVQMISMFNNEKIIFIENPIDQNIDLFQNIFEDLPDKILIIVITNNLKKTSKIRKFFEDSNQYISCANYEDDLKINSQQINELEKSINKVFDKDTKNYLNQNLSSDRMISKNEIEKITLLFSNTNEEPKLEKIQSVFNDNADLGLNKISQLVFSGNPNGVSIFLNKIFDEGINSVAIIRTILTYVQRIETTQIALKKTDDFDMAIRGLKPPVFWKDKDLFKLHCKKWPISETVSNFSLLVETELKCKNDYQLTNILCERALIKIASKGSKYFN